MEHFQAHGAEHFGAQHSSSIHNPANMAYSGPYRMDQEYAFLGHRLPATGYSGYQGLTDYVAALEQTAMGSGVADTHVQQMRPPSAPVHVPRQYLPYNDGPMAPRRADPGSSSAKALDWERFRPIIRRYYLDDGKTLEETQTLMKDVHGFDASPQMYKRKFKEWNFNKQIHGPNAKWMLEHATKRKREDKGTVYYLAGRPLTQEQIERSAKRSKAAADDIVYETPPGITYHTPSTVVHSPMLTTSQLSGSSRRRWKPEFAVEESRNRRPQFVWKDLAKTDLDSMQEEARSLERLGRLDEAEQKYRTALSGLQHLLPAMHGDTITLAKRLASLYAGHDRLKDAYAILQWMMELHIELWGLENEKTTTNMENVVDMLSSWHRAADAMVLVSRLWSNSALELESVCSEWLPNEDSDMDRLNYDLALSRLQGKSDVTKAEETLLGTFRRYQHEFLQYPLQMIRALKALLVIHRSRGESVDQHEILSQAAGQIDDLLRNLKDSNAEVFVAAADLVKQCITSEEYGLAKSISHKIEDWVEEKLSRDGPSVVHVLTRLGLNFQGAGMWNDARPFFEHALASALTYHGYECSCTTSLEQALENEHYDITTAGILRDKAHRQNTIRPRLRPRNVTVNMRTMFDRLAQMSR